MSTIFDYLKELKEQNPEYKKYSNVSLYNELRGQDPSLPRWDELEDAKANRPKGQSNYERKQNPDLANQLIDWTDWGIDENSAKWAQNAYNQSIAGMAYQLYNGEQKFDLEGYNPGIAQDIGSAVLSFMMPLDLLSMATGGVVGKGFSTLAGYGMRKAATKNLVKLSGKKLTKSQLSRESKKQLAKRTADAQDLSDLIISEDGYAALFSAYAPKASGAIMQGATLATFEGARGGVQAAINDEDVWGGIMKGAAHGGMMGGLAGAVGSGLNIRHAKLIENAKNKVSTRGESYAARMADKAELMATGTVGQVGAEATVFTAADLKNVITDEDYSMRDLLRNYAVNIGMMGTLKAKSKLWDKATKPMKEYYQELKREIESSETLNKSKDTIIEEINKQIEGAETPEQKVLLERQKAEVQKLTEVELKELEVKKQDYNNWEKDFNDAKDLIDKGSDLSKVKVEKIQNTQEQVQKIYGSIIKNINKFKQDNPALSKEAKIKLKEMESFKEQWEKEILEPLNNIENLKRQSKTFTSSEVTNARKDFKQVWKDATKKGDEQAKQELRKGLEDKITEKGEIKDEVSTIDLIDKAQAYKTSLKEKGQLDIFEKPVKPTKKVEKTKEEKKALIPKPKTFNQKIKTSERKAESDNFINLSKIVKRKNPKALKNIQKNLGKLKGEYALTKVQERLIDIVQKKKKVDSKPAVSGKETLGILKSIQTKPSEKLLQEGVSRFGSQKSLMKAIDAYKKGTISVSDMSKLKPWLAKNTNYLKSYFKIKNKADVINIKTRANIGAKTPIDFLDLGTQFRYKSLTNKTKTGKQLLESTHKRVIEMENELKSRKDIPYNEFQLQDILTHTTGRNKIEIKGKDKMTLGELNAYESRLNSLIMKGKKVHKNILRVEKSELDYNVNKRQRDDYFKEVHNSTIKKATNEQLDMYEAYIKKGNQLKPKETIIQDSLISINQNKNNPGVAAWKRAFMTSTDVLIAASKKIKGAPSKALKSIARNINGHDYTYNSFKGEGSAAVRRISKMVSDKKVRKKYMHFIDSKMANKAIKQLEILAKKDKSYRKELKEMKQVRKDFAEGGKFHEAKKAWKEYTDYIWSQFGVEISKHTKSNREFQKIMEGLNEKYIKEYFSRRPKKEVLEFLEESSPAIQRLADKHIKDLTKSDLKKIAQMEGVSLSKLDNKTIRDAVSREIFNMFSYGPIKANPGFLKKRGVQLPEYLEITGKDGRKKFIKTYESSVEGTMSQYVEGMSKFLATVRHFPEFTKLSSKFSAKGSQNVKLLEAMAGSKDMGSYAYNLIKKQLGLDYSTKDTLIKPALKWAGKATNISALAGLSSPLAGFKNIIIQIPRSVALYGTRNTTRGIAKAMQTWGSEKAYLEAIKRGETGYGTRELIQKEGKFMKFWFDNVNLMTKTENFNRIVLAESGRLHFTELLNVARGEKTMFHPNGKASEVKRMFKETWKLSEKEIDFLTKTQGVQNTRRFQEILLRVGHESHKAGAGATGTGDLPLWMSNKYVRPLTLFQRMATSVTIDSYKNYIKPLKNGNPMPLIKATIGHGLSGWALYSMYDWALGQQVPTEESPGIDKAMSYLWRGEMLGVFGEVLSPYDVGAFPIMEPVLLRNLKHAGDEVLKVFGEGKGLDEAMADFGKKTFVLASQMEKGWNKIKHPYVTNSKRIKTLTRQWESQMEYTKSHGDFISSRQPYYWDLKEAIMFGKDRESIGGRYWAAFNFICNELENIENISSKSEREKRAHRALKAVIRNMNPINVSSNVDGRQDSKRNEFLKWLSKENRELALKLEKQYKYKTRALESIIRDGGLRGRYSIYP
tara:strand:- start:7879 stop:13332 length:5454 start_codon:yes stop_codon:yes gene_type:complete